MRKILLFLGLILSLGLSKSTLAQTQVHPADSVTLCNGSGYVATDTIIIYETAATDFLNPGTGRTYVIDAPANTEFNPGIGTAWGSDSIINMGIVVTSNQITLTFDHDDSLNDDVDSIYILGVQVRAIADNLNDTLLRTGGSANQLGNGIGDDLVHLRIYVPSDSTPNVAITPSIGGAICAGTQVTFTVTDSTGGGDDADYAWYVNGGAVGVDSFNYTTNSLSNNDSVAVVMTSSALCPTAVTDTASIVMTVNPLLAPSVTMSPDVNPACTGANVTFTVTDSTNGGNDPTFAWFVNGGPVGTDRFEYQDNTLSDNDSVSVIMTSIEACAVPTTDTANVTMTITGSIVPNVSFGISANPSCAGDNVTFTVNDSTNGGNDPSFQWKINGTPVGVDNYQYTTNTLANNDLVRVIMTSNAACPSPTTDSMQVLVTVNPVVVPNVAFNTSANPICNGDNVTFTVNDSTNGGTDPSFQWKVNGTPVGTDNYQYSSTTLNNGDDVRVVMTPNVACPNPALDSANVLMTVNPLDVPNVTMSADANPVCLGTNVTFTVTDSTGAGNDPSFAWFVNGGAVGTDRFEYQDNTLTNGDSVSVIITSNATCPSPTTDTSNVTMIITANLLPSVTMSPDLNPSCVGTNITFTVTDSTNGGNDPTFAWFVNGGAVGADNYQYSDNTLSDGDSVSVIMTSNDACALPIFDTSNVTMSLNTIPVGAPTITGDTDPCEIQDTAVLYRITTPVANTTDYVWYLAGYPGQTDITNLAFAASFDSTGLGTDSAYFDFSAVGEADDGHIIAVARNECGLAVTADFEWLNVRPIPPIQGIVGDATPNCNTTGEMYNVPNPSGPDTYLWVVASDVTINGGSGGQSVDIDMGTLDTLLTLQEITPYGCIRNNTLSYNYQGCGLTADYYVDDSNACVNVPITFMDTSSGTSGGTTYFWDFGAGATPATANTIGPHSVTYSTPGAKSVKLRITEGASDSITKSIVTVNALPTELEISGDHNPNCYSTGNVYSVPNTPGSIYLWSVPSGATITSGDSTSSITVDFGDNNGVIRVDEITTAGCQAIAARGNSFYFDGNDDYTIVDNAHESNFDITSALTLECWIRVDAFTNNWQNVISKGNDTYRLHRYNNTNFIGFGTNGLSGPTDLQGSTNINDGKWHHIAAVYDGANKYIYVDGVLDASEANTGNINTNNTDVRIGRNTANNNMDWEGWIDEVRIWNIARTPAEIVANMNDTITAPVSGLVAYYKFDDLLGPTGTNPYPKADASGNGYNGDVHNIYTNIIDSDGDPEVFTSKAPFGNSSKSITLTGCGLAAGWTSTKSALCSGDTVTFVNATNGATGGATYNWDFGTGATPATATGIGPHQVTYNSATTITPMIRLIVIDGVSDTSDNNITVNRLPQIVISDSTDILCFGDNTGQAVSTASLGDGTFNYSWTNAAFTPIGQIDDTATSLAAGTYNVIVTDGQGCRDTATVTLSQPAAALDASGISKTDVTVNGGSDGTATVTPTGGTPGYTYDWTPDPGNAATDTDSIATGLSQGLYSVLVTDANGCTDVGNITINQPNAINPGVIGLNGTVAAFADVCQYDTVPEYSNIVAASGGVGAFLYFYQMSFDLTNWITLPASQGVSPTHQSDSTIILNTFIRRGVQSGSDTAYTSSVVLFYHAQPTTSLFGLPAEQICFGDSGTYQGNPNSDSSRYTTLSAGLTDNLDGTFEFNAATAGVGIHYIDYYYADNFGCNVTVTDSIEVLPLPVVNLNGLEVLYSSSSPPDTLQGTPAGGSFSGNGMSGGVFFPGSIAIGVPTYITYTYTDVNGCTNSDVDTTLVTSATGTITGIELDYCETRQFDTLVANHPGDSVRQWLISGGGGFIYISTDLDTAVIFVQGLYALNPPSPSYNVSFDYWDGGASFTAPSTAITIHQNPQINTIGAGFPDQFCEDQDTVNLFDYIIEKGGVFSMSSGIVQDSMYLASLGNVGSLDTIRYTRTENHGSATCTNFIQKNGIMIDLLPTPTIVGFHPDSQYCANEGAQTLTASPIGQSRSWNGPLGLTPISDTVYSFQPSVAIQNTVDTISYQVTDSNGCSATFYKQITIDSVSNVSVTGSATNICEGDSLTLEGLVGGGTALDGFTSMFSGPGIVDADTTDAEALFFANLATPGGPYTVEYLYVNGNTCRDSTTFDIVVDSLHSVSYVMSDSMDTYCSNESVKTFNATSTAAGTYSWFFNGTPQGSSPFFNPQTAGIGQTIVRVEHTANCIATFIDTITVNAAPTADFGISGACIADTTVFTDQSTIASDTIVAWRWDFDVANVGADTAVVQDPQYKYATDGSKDVELIVTSNNGCVDNDVKTFVFENNPSAEFTWTNECQGDSTVFQDLSSSGSSIVQWDWDFADGDTAQIIGAGPGDISHQYNTDSAFNVRLVIRSVDGCTDTVINTVNVRPFIDFSTNQFEFADFESGNNGWLPASGDTNSSWELGIVPNSQSVINDAASGQMAYVTNLNGNYNLIESSSVVGPCFDFTNLTKPMIKIKYKSGIIDTDHGAVLQVQWTDSTNTTVPWQNLGDFDNGNTSGVNWYNSASIDAIPGGVFTRGWTGVSTSGADTVWLEARHDLDFLKDLVNISNVRFRVAFASDGGNPFEGFAFDDIWVGNRSRIVLAEHFTNNNVLCATCESVDDAIDNIIQRNENPRDVIDIQYHINSPGADPLFAANSADPNSRSLVYAVPSHPNIPYLAMDGNQFNGLSNDWATDSLYLRKRALIDPQFDIDLTYELNAGAVTVKTVPIANDTIVNEKLFLLTALVEKQVVENSASNGDTLFRNVLRKILPNASGLLLAADWVPGDSSIYVHGHSLFNFNDQTELAVVAFIQNDVTKEVYQAAYADVPTAITGYVEHEQPLSGLNYSLFPNPANNEFNLAFSAPLEAPVSFELVNMLGQPMYSGSLDKKQQFAKIPSSDLAAGVYLLKVIYEDKVAGVNRILIEH